jgi:hypothetical protein
MTPILHDTIGSAMQSQYIVVVKNMSITYYYMLPRYIVLYLLYVQQGGVSLVFSSSCITYVFTAGAKNFPLITPVSPRLEDVAVQQKQTGSVCRMHRPALLFDNQLDGSSSTKHGLSGMEEVPDTTVHASSVINQWRAFMEEEPEKEQIKRTEQNEHD